MSAAPADPPASGASVMLNVEDPLAQDLLAEYAARLRERGDDRAGPLEAALKAAGYTGDALDVFVKFLDCRHAEAAKALQGAPFGVGSTVQLGALGRTLGDLAEVRRRIRDRALDRAAARDFAGRVASELLPALARWLEPSAPAEPQGASTPRWHVVEDLGELTGGLVVYCDDDATNASWPPAWARPGAAVSVVPYPDQSTVGAPP